MKFRGEFAFLSNFSPARVFLDSMEFPTVENAYMAAKTLNPLERAMFQKLSPADAKRMGRKVRLRPDWDKIKLVVMYRLLQQKFNLPEYKKKLLDTGTIQLVEENTWGDKYWGVCNGEGQNYLGRLLMKIRAELVV